MKSSQNESHFLDMTALQMAEPFSPSTYRVLVFLHSDQTKHYWTFNIWKSGRWKCVFYYFSPQINIKK